MGGERRGLWSAAVPADPDIALVVDVDAVVRSRPVVTLARSAPMPDQVARLVELEDGRGGRAARRSRRIHRQGFFPWFRPALPLDDPDVVLRIHPHSTPPAA